MSSHNPAESTPHTPEADLMLAIRRQGEVFAQAVQEIRNLQSDVDLHDASALSGISRLQTSLDQIVAVQQQVSTLHQRLQQSGHPVSDRMQKTLQQQEQILRSLLSEIDRLQQVFQDARSHLLPQVDADARHRTMQSAYQQSLRTG